MHYVSNDQYILKLTNKESIMSKKQERIKFLIGIYNVINSAESSPTDAKLTYRAEDIKSAIRTIQHLLKQDGIVGISGDVKVNS